MEDAVSARVRFGEFELNVKTGELCPVGRQNCTKVLLQEQPFQVLGLLIEYAGEIVTRQEIKGKLWPTDTVVDFNSLYPAYIRGLAYLQMHEGRQAM